MVTADQATGWNSIRLKAELLCYGVRATDAARAISADQNPLILYSSLGQYDVELKVTNAFGKDSILKLDYINIIEPMALLSGNSVINSGQTAYLKVD